MGGRGIHAGGARQRKQDPMNTIKSKQRVAGHGEVFTKFDILPPLAYIWTSTASTTPLRKQNNDRSAWPRQTLARPTETHGASMALRNGDRAV